MDDARELQYGIGFETSEADDAVDQLTQRVDELEQRLGAAEMGAQRFGAGAVSACRTGQESADRFTGALEATAGALGETSEGARTAADTTQQFGRGLEATRDALDRTAEGTRSASDITRQFGRSLDDAGDDAEQFRSQIRKAAQEADSLGDAFRTTMADGLEAGQSIAKSFRTGITGALDFSRNKVKTFVSDTLKGAKNIGTAFKSPVQTIRNSLVEALKKAKAAEDETGDGAEDAERDLNDMGDAGANAGNTIKEAMSGAIKTFVGFEAIKKGIELMKQFGAAALESFGATETSAAKFDRVFSDEVAGWVDNYADAVHRSTTEVKGFMVQNQAMYREMGVTADQAETLSEITTSLGYDFGNAFRMEDAEALSLVQSAIQGDTAALSEFGIILDETALKQSAAALGVSNNIDALDDATAAQVRLNAILEQSADIQQAAINNTGGLVNSTKSLKGVFSEFMADAGGQFTPVLEGLFGAVLDNWPTVEPMLMEFVGMLAEGLGDATPVVMELGQTLIPILTDVLGSLFSAAMPLVSIFDELASVVLPPLANIAGMIADSVLPPLVDILGTLTTSIIQPLMGPLQSIASALLPPIAQLLGLVSPLLEGISPVLSIIGDGLGIIADALGSLVGWLADGAGKVVGFFSNLFGGTKESTDAVEDLTGAVSDLDGAAGMETSLAIDTSEYSSSVSTAAQEATNAVTEAATATREISNENYTLMANDAETAYARMTLDAEEAWERMTTSADNGAKSIVASFASIATAAEGINSANITVSGVTIPHNAEGTNDFEGGWTHMSEEGGELAYLPSGTAIIPADKTDEIINNSTPSNGYVDSSTFAPQISIILGGDASPESADDLAQKVKDLMEKFWREKKEQEYHDRAMQGAYAR